MIRNTKSFKIFGISLAIVMLLSGIGFAYADGAKEMILDPALVAEMIPPAESFTGGNGTEDDPYQIETAEQLALLSKLCTYENNVTLDDTDDVYRSAYYVLTADIDLNDISDFEHWDTSAPKYGWIPIGMYHFDGCFDGQGHTIRGMYIYSAYVYDDHGSAGYEDEPGKCAALFGQLRNGAVVKNVTVSDSLIHHTGRFSSVGGIANQVSSSTLENCVSDVTILGEDSIGGVVCSVYDSHVDRCKFTGRIIIPYGGGRGNIGGVAQHVTGDSMITDCESNGTIEAAGSLASVSPYIGGLIGSVSGYYTLSMLDESHEKNMDVIHITDCVNETDIAVDDGTVGGLIAKVSVDFGAAVTIENCENNGDITVEDTDEEVGGLIGLLFNSNFREEYVPEIAVINCQNSGDISAPEIAGGILGGFTGNMTWSLKDCTNTGNVSSALYAGGMVGQVTPARYKNEIIDCRNEGSIHTESGIAGGMIGQYFGFSLAVPEEDAEPLYIRSCVNTGEISNDGGIGGIGGIIGSQEGLSGIITTHIENCLNEGNICGGTSTRAGGILGSSAFSMGKDAELAFEIKNCANTGRVTQGDGKQEVSMLHQGLMEMTDEMLENLDPFAETMLIFGGSSIGGLVGYSQGVLIKNCVSGGDIFIDSDYIPIMCHEDLATYYAASAAVGEDEGFSGYVFCGGICGMFYSFGGDYISGEGGMTDCTYAEPVPAAYCEMTEDAGETIMGVQRVDRETAMKMAADVISD